VDTKYCSNCGEDKPFNKFYKQYGGRTDYHPHCKDCRNQYAAKRRKENKERYHGYDWKNNLKKHGLSPAKYEKLFTVQNGLCAICNKSETDSNQHGIKRLAVDHNHGTKEIRGLLCAKCNRGLGLFDDDVEKLLNAAVYLEGTT